MYWVKVGSEMARVELYKGYRILAYQRHPPDGRWLAEIRKADGSALVILPPDGGTREFITTSAATFSSEAAIVLAKRAINGGGMK
jgi:hypothetical protein